MVNYLQEDSDLLYNIDFITQQNQQIHLFPLPSPHKNKKKIMIIQIRDLHHTEILHCANLHRFQNTPVRLCKIALVFCFPSDYHVT